MLVSQTPGGLHERFFKELGEEAWDPTIPPVMDGPPDFESLAAIAARQRHRDTAAYDVAADLTGLEER